MKLTRTISYAVQAMIALSELDRSTPVSGRQLADYGKLPEKFLLQILRNLVANGVLCSVRACLAAIISPGRRKKSRSSRLWMPSKARCLRHPFRNCPDSRRPPVSD